MDLTEESFFSQVIINLIFFHTYKKKNKRGGVDEDKSRYRDIYSKRKNDNERHVLCTNQCGEKNRKEYKKIEKRIH